MDWWSELWLNEGFATWVGWLAVDHLYPGKTTLLKFVLDGPEETDVPETEWNVWGQFVVRCMSKATNRLRFDMNS